MNRTLTSAIGFGLLAGTLLAADPPSLDTPEAKLSYSLGWACGDYLKRQQADLDLDLVVQTMKEVLSGNPTLLTSNEMVAVVKEHQQRVRAKIAEASKQQSEAFLAENAKKPGVITLPSGLQYEVITEGTGAVPKATDTVVTQYRGSLVDGTEFDSSYSRGKPYETPANRVIKGWSEALQLMKTGSKWRLFIPSDLAYGPSGRGRIPPHAALIFDVELLEVKAAEPAVVKDAKQTVVTSDIIKVPSAEELKKGAQIKVIKAEDIEKEIEAEKKAQEKKDQQN